MKIWAIVLFCLLTLEISAVVYRVGPGRTYTSLQQVTGRLNPGDIVEVDGNTTYAGDVKFTRSGSPGNKIIIRGIRVNGKRPILSGGTNTVAFTTPRPYSGPGADHYIFEGFEVTGGSSRGIYHQANDLTIRDTLVRDCFGQGVHGADQGSGSITMQYVEVTNCGSGTYHHQVYMATDEVHHPGSVFRMEYCYIHDGNGGNNIKSRAERNEIYYNRIEGAYYHELELIGPDGGDGGTDLVREDSDVVGNIIWSKTNHFTTRVGGDGTGETNGRYRFVNNTFICMSPAVFRIFDGIESIQMHNNVFHRLESGNAPIYRTVEADWSTGRELIAGSNNWVKEESGSAVIPPQWTGTMFGTDPGFINAEAGDFRIKPTSDLNGAGSQSLSGPAGYPFPRPLFPPTHHPPLAGGLPLTQVRPRPPASPIAIGAFAYYANADNPDFNRDAHPDLLWHHRSSGNMLLWYMEGGKCIADVSVPYMHPAWECCGQGDFNGDGNIDIVWRNKYSGENRVWLMNNTTRLGIAALPAAVNLQWSICGIADANNDGHPDIYWRNNENGKNAVWYMNGTTRTDIAVIQQAHNTQWQIVAVVDFDKDGHVDLIWRNGTTGQNVIWYMKGIERSTIAFLPIARNTEWHCVGCGDFNNDNQIDILWRNVVTGSNVIWYMNGRTRIDLTFLQTVPDVDWEIVN